jgi:hypothetical protein
MTFDVIQECTSILDLLPDTLPDHSSPGPSYTSELPEFLRRLAPLMAELQQEFPSLAGKKLGGLNRLYAYDPATYNATLERDVVAHWLRYPESLELTYRQIAAAASYWYDRPVTEHRIKRRFRDPDLPCQLQKLCYEHDNVTNISACRSLPEIQKRLRLRARQSADKWTFRAEITFYGSGTVQIGNRLARQDRTASGKGRVRGNGSAVPVDALRNVLLAYS